MKKILSIFFVLFLISCAGNTGTKFQKLDEVKNDEAIIYFYRPSAFGAMIHYTVKDDEKKPIQKVYPYSYFLYKTNKFGKREFSATTEATKKISFDVEAGKTYFVESNIGWGILVGRPKFKLIEDKEKALKDLKECSIMLNENN